MKARSTGINITYEGKNITQDIAPYLLSFTFNDNSGNTADDITVSLEDRDGLWFSEWAPSKGDVITASIITHEGKSKSLPCGKFTVDQIEYSMPPKILNIKAISTSIAHGMRHEAHNQAWENVNISTIAGDIASRNGLSLYYDAEEYMASRIEQVNKPDLEFISGLGADYGLSVKVRDGKLILYDVMLNEENESVNELNITDKAIISCKFTSKSAEVYRKAHVKYHDSVSNETYEGESEDEDEEGSERILEIREKVSGSGEATQLAEKRLYNANKGEVTGSIKLRGDIRYSAGINITLSDFGMFSGKYTVSKVTHKIDSSGYTTELSLGETSSSKKDTGQKKRAKTKRKGTESQILYYEGEKYYGNKKQ